MNVSLTSLRRVGRIRVKELVRRIFFGVVVGSIVAAMRTRGVSSSAACSSSSREARGCESWQWCGPSENPMFGYSSKRCRRSPGDHKRKGRGKLRKKLLLGLAATVIVAAMMATAVPAIAQTKDTSDEVKPPSFREHPFSATG